MHSDAFTDLLPLTLPLATVLLVFAMKYGAAAFGARARLAAEASYRELAERAVSAQAANQAVLGSIQAELGRLAVSLAAVEHILKQVD